MTSKGLVSLSTSNSAEVKRAAKILMLMTERTATQMVLWRSKIVTYDLVKATPPRGKHPSEESFREQRQRGMKNVLRDVVKLFPALANLHLIQHPGNPDIVRAVKYIDQYIKDRNLSAINKMLADFGMPVPLVLADASETVHQGARDPQTGKVKAKTRYPVLNIASIVPLIRKLYKDVGKMKHGWIAAAEYLNVKGIPAWIKSQPAPPGYKQDDTNGVRNPSFTIGSNARGIERMGDIVKNIVEINEHKMLVEANAKLPALFRKYGTIARTVMGL